MFLLFLLPAECERAQADFVEKVSEETLLSLINKLTSDGIITTSEKNEILEKSTKEKAQHLSELVRKKGMEAGSGMKIHLEKLDPALFSCVMLSKFHTGSISKSWIVF